MTYHNYNTRYKKKSNTDNSVVFIHRYNTRQQIKKKELDVSIDFDDASKQWRKNKRHTGNGCFVYKKN